MFYIGSKPNTSFTSNWAKAQYQLYIDPKIRLKKLCAPTYRGLLNANKNTPPPLFNSYKMTSTTTVPPLSSDSGSDSDTNAIDNQRHTDLSDTIFRSYIEITGGSSSDLVKIQSFLTSSRSGALSCLICLERIRPSDPTWSCTSRCYAVFHLLCIQSWARQSSDLAAARAATRLTITPSRAASDDHSVWNCPKCRIEYPKTLIPRKYTCFCGKLENPPHDPWVLPHSCGEICDRPLMYECGHYCLLLCHPGPCPSCPKLVKTRCFCGVIQDVKRCGFKNFSCNGTCSKVI